MIESERSRNLKDKARQDLSRYRDAMQTLQYCTEVLHFMRQRADGLTGIRLTDKVQISAGASAREYLLCKIADYRSELDAKAQEAEQICLEIMGKINRLSDTQAQHILSKRYLLGLSLEEIADSEHYTVRTVKRYLAKALELYGENIVP